MPRLVDVFARRLQVQERLTTAIAEALESAIPVAICGDSAQKEQIAHCLDRYEGIADTIVELFQPHGSGVIASSQAVDLEVADKKMSDSPKQSASSAAMRPQGQ